MRNHLHQHWAATGPLVETEPSQHVQAKAAWLSDRCVEAKLTPEQKVVVVDRIAGRVAFGHIRKSRRLQKGQAEALFREGLARLETLPGFWDAAREFERELVPCAENKSNFDERPYDLRGVNPDRSSDRFQGARCVPRDDRRVRQSAADACRLWAAANA